MEQWLREARARYFFYQPPRTAYWLLGFADLAVLIWLLTVLGVFG